MSAERTGEIPSCPYWLRRVEYNGSILVLCGAESPGELPLPDGEEGLRLSQCPFFGLEDDTKAFEWPAIIEISPQPVVISGEFRDYLRQVVGDYADLRLPYTRKNIVFADGTGGNGIAELEEVWPQKEKEFMERHSQP